MLIAVVSIGILGCSDDSPNNNGTDPGTNDSRVRLLHFVYDGAGLDLYVDGKKLATNVQFGQSSGYKAATQGKGIEVAVYKTGDTVAAKSSLQEISDKGAHTVYAFPPAAAFAAGFRFDDITADPAKVRVKLANATYAKEREEYELYITGMNNRILGPVARALVTDYTDRFPGSYSFTLKRVGDPDFIMVFENVTLIGGNAYTLVLHGTSDETDAYPLAIRMFTDNGAGNEYKDLIHAPNTSNVMYANAVWGSNKIDIAVDGSSTLVGGLTYGTGSKYSTYASGPHKVSAASGQTAIAENASMNLTTNTFNTFFFVGSMNPPNLSTMLLTDQTNPNPTQALVRFINLSPDAGDVNVIAPLGPGNDYPIPGMQGIGYKEVSVSSANPGENFLNLPPGNYTLKFYHVNRDSVLRELYNYQFVAGKIYTLWYGGLVSDNSLFAYTLTHN